LEKALMRCSLSLIRPAFMVVLCGLLTTGIGCPAGLQASESKMNVLIITVDDMSCDSVGVYGCKLAGTTPTMDALASQSMRFLHAHVQVGNCMPSRNVMFSGRYPHNNRVEGFYQIKDPDYPVMCDLMKQAGYFTGIRHKVSHSTPYSPYPSWDVVLDSLPDGTAANTKDPHSYYLTAKYAMDLAKQANKPFCLNLNIADPHKPFFNEGKKPDPNQPSRVFTADEVPVPGFLPDSPVIREELARYYSSVRRADDGLAGILRALKESGQDEQTVIFFLSDHGMPLPFAKTQLYYHSTRTPWMVRWPGTAKAGSVDDQHMISGVDLLPTLLDIVGIEHPSGMDGRSFAPLLKGEKQANRDTVVTEYNENSGGNRHPMRAIVTKDFAYIFNPWSNGQRAMATATKGTDTYREMNVLAKTDSNVAARLNLFEHRVPEELYNYAIDSDALKNLADDPNYQAEYRRITSDLEAWMVQTRDPMLEVFRKRKDKSVREAYMQEVEQAAEARRLAEGKKNKNKKSGKGKKKAADDVE
jgi:N-sulfoglucosamine sulfohydrolase